MCALGVCGTQLCVAMGIGTSTSVLRGSEVKSRKTQNYMYMYFKTAIVIESCDLPYKNLPSEPVSSCHHSSNRG